MKTLIAKFRNGHIGTETVAIETDPVKSLENALTELKSLHAPIEEDTYSFEKEAQKWNKRAAKACHAADKAKTPEAKKSMNVFMEQAKSYESFYREKINKVKDTRKKLSNQINEIELVLGEIKTSETNRKINLKLEEMSRSESINVAVLAASPIVTSKEINRLIHGAKALMELRSTPIA